MYLVRVIWLDVVLWTPVLGFTAFLSFLPHAIVRWRREELTRRTGAYVDPGSAAPEWLPLLAMLVPLGVWALWLAAVLTQRQRLRRLWPSLQQGPPSPAPTGAGA